MKSLGGYYSKFKHAFLFKENPSDKLNATVKEIERQIESATDSDSTEKEKEETVNYVITEDIHTKTGKQIWIAKPEKELSKNDFADVKRKLATIQGFYSTFKHGFIFNYNPKEALQTV